MWYTVPYKCYRSWPMFHSCQLLKSSYSNLTNQAAFTMYLKNRVVFTPFASANLAPSFGLLVFTMCRKHNIYSIITHDCINICIIVNSIRKERQHSLYCKPLPTKSQVFSIIRDLYGNSFLWYLWKCAFNHLCDDNLAFHKWIHQFFYPQ